VRAGILEGLQWAGVELDAARNSAAVGGEACISRADSAVEAWVVPVDEAAVLAQEAMTVVQAQGAAA
jgi:acetate kinase